MCLERQKAQQQMQTENQNTYDETIEVFEVDTKFRHQYGLTVTGGPKLSTLMHGSFDAYKHHHCHERPQESQAMEMQNLREKKKIKKYMHELPYKSSNEKTFLTVDTLKQLEFSRVFTKMTLKEDSDEFKHMTNWSRIFE